MACGGNGHYCTSWCTTCVPPRTDLARANTPTTFSSRTRHTEATSKGYNLAAKEVAAVELALASAVAALALDLVQAWAPEGAEWEAGADWLTFHRDPPC